MQQQHGGIPRGHATASQTTSSARVSPQVHKARLQTGEEVAVKVQRKGLRRLFEIDLANLEILAKQLDAQEEGRDFTGIFK